jgi:hypothetical protein
VSQLRGFGGLAGSLDLKMGRDELRRSCVVEDVGRWKANFRYLYMVSIAQYGTEA